MTLMQRRWSDSRKHPSITGSRPLPAGEPRDRADRGRPGLPRDRGRLGTRLGGFAALAQVLAVLLLFLHLAPAANARQEASSSPATPEATTPIYPNPSCPIMGKPVSTRLFAETEMGRIYVCCKSCIKDILADVPTAYRTAYPVDKQLANKVCPVTGAEITKESPRVVLQGFEFSVRSKDDVRAAREASQIVLAKLNDPKLADLDNKTCPVTGDPVGKNAFVVIESTIVRLSSAKLLEEIAKEPGKILAKAKTLRGNEEKKGGAKEESGEGKKP